MKRLLRVVVLGAPALCVAPALAGNADEAMRTCRNGASAADRVAACDFVIFLAKDPGALARAHNRRGHANVELGRYADAVRDFTVVIRLNPEVGGYYDNRRNALKLAGRLPEALRDADAAVRLAPTHAFVLSGRASVHDAMGHADLAIADMTRAIALDLKWAGLRVDRAKYYEKIGRGSDAFVDLTNAITLDPGNPEWLKARGLFLARAGERERATSDLVGYLTVKPGDPEAVLALSALAPPAIAKASPPPVVSPATREAEALDAKKKLVVDAVSAHEDCLAAALVDITPYSAESAPTIVDVVLDRCAAHAEKRIAIGVAAYDMTREEAKAIVDRKVAEMRTKMISVVVTARAEAAKKREAQEPAGPTTSEGLPKAQPL